MSLGKKRASVSLSSFGEDVFSFTSNVRILAYRSFPHLVIFSIICIFLPNWTATSAKHSSKPPTPTQRAPTISDEEYKTTVLLSAGLTMNCLGCNETRSNGEANDMAENEEDGSKLYWLSREDWEMGGAFLTSWAWVAGSGAGKTIHFCEPMSLSPEAFVHRKERLCVASRSCHNRLADRQARVGDRSLIKSPFVTRGFVLRENLSD
jgi:hypothetical protein